MISCSVLEQPSSTAQIMEVVSRSGLRGIDRFIPGLYMTESCEKEGPLDELL